MSRKGQKESILSASSHPMLPLAIRTLFQPFEDSKMATLVPSCKTKRSTLVWAGELFTVTVGVVMMAWSGVVVACLN